MVVISEKLNRYASTRTKQPPTLLKQLEDRTCKEISYQQMLTGHIEGRFLKMLVQISGAKNVLDIGMYTGYSALSMAEGLPGRRAYCYL